MNDERLHNKLDQIDTRLNSIDKTLVEQSADLKHHIRRTELAEENLELLRGEIKPLKKTVHMAEGVFKAIGVLAVLVSVLKALTLL